MRAFKSLFRRRGDPYYREEQDVSRPSAYLPRYSSSDDSLRANRSIRTPGYDNELNPELQFQVLTQSDVFALPLRTNVREGSYLGYGGEERYSGYRNEEPLSGYRIEEPLSFYREEQPYSIYGNTTQRHFQSVPRPRWKISRPIVYEKGHPAYLCPTCRTIDLEFLFYDSEPGATAVPDEYIALGLLKDISEKTECGLCRMVAGIARLAPELRAAADARARGLESVAEQLSLECCWYLSPFRYSHEQYGPGFQLFLRRNVFDPVELPEGDHMVPSYPLGIRLLIDEARGGRAVPPDHMDFDWVKRTVELCERSTDMPPPKFKHPVRCIDTKNFCVVDLPHNTRYLTLSYPWGNATQIKLTRQTAYIRDGGGLRRIFDQIPRTIQDAMELVIKVGERYLWVDSLCILQDDKEDIKRQMEQMSEIYRNSFFTIFAVSGADANYGLSMVQRGTRKHKQQFEKVNDMWITNTLPWIEDHEFEFKGSWSTRGWTYQERLKSQRALFVADDGVIFNCMHVYSPEDEHCWHSLQRDEGMISKGDFVFYDGLNKGAVPYLKHSTTFDSYAMMVSGYSQRHLTYQKDAPMAFLGVIDFLEGQFSSQFIHALPEGEIDAALLWSPIGSSNRRCDPTTGKPLFPSWSWLGWIGHAAYPWALERDSFMSPVTSPLEWKNADDTLPEWFKSDDLYLPPSDRRESILADVRKKTEDHLGVYTQTILARRNPKFAGNAAIQWPNRSPPRLKYLASPTSHRLTFRTLTCEMNVEGPAYRREGNYNVKYPVYRMSVWDPKGRTAGYIDVPDPATRKITACCYKFVVLSRSTIDGLYEPGPDKLIRSRMKESTEKGPYKSFLDKKGNFDRRFFDARRSWCMFNVLMVEEVKEADSMAYYRVASGRLHVDAVIDASLEYGQGWRRRDWGAVIRLE